VWTEIAAPAGLGLAGLDVTSAVSVAPDDFLFAASVAGGAPGTPAQGQVKVVRWTRGNWSGELTATAPAGWISRVSATAPDDAWAVLAGTLYHRDAGGWRAFDASWAALVSPGSAASGPAPAVGPIGAGGRGEVWAVTSGALLHWVAGAWKAFPIPVDEPNLFYDSFSTIWVGAPNDVWLGGSIGHLDGGPIYNPALLMHFDGSSFVTQPFGLWNVFALWSDGGGGVWAAVPNNVRDNANLTIYHGAVADSSRGFVPIAAWPEVAAARSLWGRAADDIWAAGEDVAHWDGAKWSRSNDVPDAARAPLNGGATIVTGDAGSIWLVARGPRFFRLGVATP
jgi:hypothetical protein